MKTAENLRQQLHSLIEAIKDEHVLKVLNEDMISFVINSHIESDEHFNNDLNPEELTEFEIVYKKRKPMNALLWPVSGKR